MDQCIIIRVHVLLGAARQVNILLVHSLMLLFPQTAICPSALRNLYLYFSRHAWHCSVYLCRFGSRRIREGHLFRHEPCDVCASTVIVVSWPPRSAAAASGRHHLAICCVLKEKAMTQHVPKMPWMSLNDCVVANAVQRETACYVQQTRGWQRSGGRADDSWQCVDVVHHHWTRRVHGPDGGAGRVEGSCSFISKSAGWRVRKNK